MQRLQGRVLTNAGFALAAVAFMFVAGANAATWRTTHGPTGGGVDTLSPSPDGSVLATSGDAVLRLYPQSSRWTLLIRGLSAVPGSKVAVDAQGNAYVMDRNGIVYQQKLERHVWLVVGGGSGLPAFTSSLPLTVTDDAHLMLGTSDGIYRLAFPSGSWEVFSSGLPVSSSVLALARRSDGDVFAATPSGVFRLSPPNTQWISENAGLPNVVSEFSAATNGDMLAISGASTYRLTFGASTWQLQSAGLLGGAVISAIGRDQAGGFIGLDQGTRTVYALSSGSGSWSSILTGPNLPLSSVATLPDGNPIIGTVQQGPYVCSTQCQRQFDGYEAARVSEIENDGLGTAVAVADNWLPTNVYRRTSGTNGWEAMPVDNGSRTSTSLSKDQAGQMFIGYAGGWARLPLGSSSWLNVPTSGLGATGGRQYTPESPGSLLAFHGGATYRWQVGWTSWASGGGAAPSQVRGFAISEFGTVLAYSPSGILQYQGNWVPTYFQPPSGGAFSLSFSLGNLYLGSDAGSAAFTSVFILQQGAWVPLGSSMPDQRTLDISSDLEGNLYALSATGTLWKLSPGSQVWMNLTEGSAVRVLSLPTKFDARGVLVGTSVGVALFCSDCIFDDGFD